jgi:DNA excision repair protein ERCC-6
LTPFHSLKGFEKRVQSTQPESSNSTYGIHESEIVARVRKSMSEIRQARPTTKLMDPASLPSLEPPTAPFQRLRRPLERPPSDGEERENKKRRRNKGRRPLPAKKWRREKLWDAAGKNNYFC